MITPQKIQELSEPVESIYTACVNELMVNIGKHITAPTWTHTAAWEVQKLSEMGQLTQENAAIINKWIKQVTPEMRRTMEFTRREALKKLEKQMEKAAEEGYVTPPLADSTVQVMNDYLGQATDRLNLVNTTMLQSSISQYSKAVNLTADIMARESATLTALNVAAGSVVTGTETRTKAVRRAIDTISKEGITGFYDRSGRSWTPEAYVNMVVRTTVHNTAIQSVKSRMQDYGTDVFQISSHAGARPRCYPYQGWFCSWSNTSGDIELGDGRTVRYRPLSDTSYGEPAGIFGINCGHYPIPIIAGLTIPHGEDNIQPKEENDKAYAESQQQRALERQIRAAKRTIEMGDNSPEAKQKLKEQQQKMRQFIKETGRTRRYDRESLMGGAQTSQKLKQNAQPATPQNVNSQLTKPKQFDDFITLGLQKSNIARNQTSMWTNQPSEQEIINHLGGGDQTKGSCSSLAFAYIGNTHGINVLDFRGGESQSFFARNSNIKHMAKLNGAVSYFAEDFNDFKSANSVLQNVVKGKTYYFAAGKHAAIVRKNDADELEYLELQSYYDNGFFKLDDNQLKRRFGCQRSHTFYGTKYKTTSVLIDADSLKGNIDFEEALCYINTDPNKQKKGKSGGIK